MTEPVSIEGLLTILIDGQRDISKKLDNNIAQTTKLGVLIKSLETEQFLSKDSIEKLHDRINNVQKDIKILCSRVGVNDEDLTSINTKVNRIARMLQTAERAIIEIAHDTRVVHDGWIEEASDRRLVFKELADELKGMQAQIEQMERDKVAAGEAS